MKLVDLTCPHCGAHLSLDDELTRATCSYCGSTLLIDHETRDVRIVNAEEAGYHFEQGRMRARQTRAKQLALIIAGIVVLGLSIALLLSLCSGVTSDDGGAISPGSTTAEPAVPADDDATQQAVSPSGDTTAQDEQGVTQGEQRESPLYVYVRTSADDDGIRWHFTFSNHGDEPVTQIILGWVALDAAGNILDNPATSFNYFEKGWDITGTPLAPATALDEVSVDNLVFTNPEYAETELMLVAVTVIRDGA